MTFAAWQQRMENFFRQIGNTHRKTVFVIINLETKITILTQTVPLQTKPQTLVIRNREDTRQTRQNVHFSRGENISEQRAQPKRRTRLLVKQACITQQRLATR